MLDILKGTSVVSRGEVDSSVNLGSSLEERRDLLSSIR
jgi:hypothetical protein